MEEKKLTDKEIVKAVKFNAEMDEGLGYIDGYKCKAIKFADILDLIHRLQSENEKLNDKNETLEYENSELKQRVSILEADNDDYKDKIAENELVSIDWHNEQVGHLEEEIERLTEERNEYKGLYETMYRKWSDLSTKDLNCEKSKEIAREYLNKNAELQMQVDELKEENGKLVTIGNGFALERNNLREELKSVQSACKSKNAKIKNLNAEKEALQNELNFQNGKPHYRYVIWNTSKNKRQFPSICEMTESGAYTKLFQKIGWDSAKYRFVVKRIKVDGLEVK